MNPPVAQCSSCGAPSDGWPDGKKTDPPGELCQMCWEKDCSESWWAMAMNFPGAVTLPDDVEF